MLTLLKGFWHFKTSFESDLDVEVVEVLFRTPRGVDFALAARYLPKTIATIPNIET